MTFLLCSTHQQCRDTNMSETAHFLPLPLIRSFGATGACGKGKSMQERKGFATGYNKCLLKLKCAHAKYFNTFENQSVILNQEICVKAKRKYHRNGSKTIKKLSVKQSWLRMLWIQFESLGKGQTVQTLWYSYCIKVFWSLMQTMWCSSM